MSYDSTRGAYGGISFSAGETRNKGLQVLQWIEYAGYAHRLHRGLTLDAGVTNYAYSREATVEYARHFAEAYIGVIGRNLSSHLFYAPNYNGNGDAAIYGEVDAKLFAHQKWTMTGHLGLLHPPVDVHDGHRVDVVDWRIGATRQLGRAAISLDWVGRSYNEYPRHPRNALILTAQRTF